MSDERVREAERRWRASGADEDEAKYLLERVRTGDLPFAKVMAAALLGYRGAVLAANNAIVAHPANGTPAEVVRMDDRLSEMRMNWPITFNGPVEEEGYSDLRAVLVLQRREGAAPIRVRVGRAIVEGRHARDTRVVLSVEVSAEYRTVDLPDVGPTMQPTTSRYLENCRSLGFPHSYSIRSRTCELCGATELESHVGGARPRFVPMGPSVESMPVSDFTQNTFVDLIDRMRRQLNQAIAIPAYMMRPEEPQPITRPPIGTINYLTGDYEMVLPPETSIQWIINYTYDGGSHASDAVSGEVQYGRGGRLNYAPIKPSTVLMQSPIFDVVDDGQGNLVPQRLAETLTLAQLREAFSANVEPALEPSDAVWPEPEYNPADVDHDYDDYDPRDPD